MIDAFLSMNTPLSDIPAALAGFDCHRVMVRDGGQTEIWQKTAEGWQMSEPGMTLFEDLSPEFVEFHAYISAPKSASTRPVEGLSGLTLSLEEGVQWLSAMERHRYAVEDSIGCGVNVADRGKTLNCAASQLSVTDFKRMIPSEGALAEKLFAFVEQALSHGADEICMAVLINTQR